MKLYFFHAPWCTACHAIENIVPGYCIKVNCDEDHAMASKFNITGLPLFVAVNSEDEEVSRVQTTNVKMVDKWFKELNNE